MQLTQTVRGIRKLQQDMNAFSKEEKRALNIAIKVEGYRRLRELRDQLKKGIPGGHPYAAHLSELARRTRTGRLRKNQVPLYRLARLVRYNVEYKNGDIQLSFGFVNTRKGNLSGSWKQMVLKHHEGTDTLYTGSRTELGRRFARIGARLKKKDDPDAQKFFLRKETGRRIDLPERPTVDPFYDANRAAMLNSIRSNYRRKLKGDRI